LRITSGPNAFQACTAFPINRISSPVWFIRLVVRKGSITSIFSNYMIHAKILTDTYIVCIISPMKIRWDPLKAEANFRKHKIRFSDAESVLFDHMALTIEDQIKDQVE
jgi:hypothetical protein